MRTSSSRAAIVSRSNLVGFTAATFFDVAAEAGNLAGNFAKNRLIPLQFCHTYQELVSLSFNITPFGSQ